MLAVSFEFNYLSGDSIGFNDPVQGSEFRAALEAAATRLGDSLLHDATIELDVISQSFDGSAVARATSEPANSLPMGGFVHAVIPEKIIHGTDLNGASADGHLEVFFFDSSDPFTYVTDPNDVDVDDEIDFQAVMIHELVHTLGFTSATRANGSDDSGNGITTPGVWSVFDQFVTDVAGNRLIDADASSPTAFQMDTDAWNVHSVGGKGPDAGLFFDGPIATSIYGGRIPLYSPATFSLQSSVAHLDSEGFPDESFVFSPLTHLMSHAIVDGPVPQELTLLEKAILADVGIMVAENVAPQVTPPANLAVEANAPGGFLGINQAIADFLAAASAIDQIDPNPIISNNKPSLLALGQNVITFTAIDASGNTGTATAVISVIDTTPPSIDVSPTSVTLEATGPDGVTNATLPFVPTVSDIVDPNPIVTFSGGTSYPFGMTTATFTARDFRNNVSTATVDIVVVDSTPPEFTLPESITIDSNLPNGADLTNAQLTSLILAAASDVADEFLEISADPPSFDIGTTVVTFTVTDDSGNASVATTSLTVDDSSLVVRTLDDELDADPASDLDDLSLREAISLANASAGIDTIRFEQGLVGSILLDAALGQLEITDSLNLIGLGSDQTLIDGQSFSRVFDISGSQLQLMIQDLTIRGGKLSGESEGGAGLRFNADGSLLLDHVRVANNTTTGTAAAGAGIHVLKGDLALVDSEVTGNQTTGEFAGGGGIWIGGGELSVHRSIFTGNSTTGNYASAGAVYSLDGATTITDSTLSGNSTSGTRSGGGAIAIISAEGTIRNSTVSGNSTSGAMSPGGGLRALLSPTRLINSTVSGNTTSLASSGGGVFVDRGDLSVDHSTITGNTASGNGGGIAVPPGSTLSLTIRNSIVAANEDGGTAPDFTGTGVLTSSNPVQFTLIGDNTGTTLSESQLPDAVSGNLVGDPGGGGVINPLLAPLADNGGLTPTHLLLPDSPAIDAGDPNFDALSFDPPLINDQRGNGFPRIFADRIDLGSVEVIGDLEITWLNPEPIVYGTMLGTDQLNASANVPGTFTYSPPADTVLEPGQAQALTAVFTPDDLSAFQPTSATVFIDVNRAEPVITWNDPAPIDFGTPLSDTQLNAVADISGTFHYAPPAGTVLDAGDDRVLSVVFVPDDTVHYNNVAATVLIDVLAIDPVVTWSNPEDITFGTPLGATQLNATANVPGSFSYIPPAGVLLNAAPNQTLTVTFTPTSTNFDPISATVKINVNKADPVVTWNDPVDIVVGTPLSDSQLNASASVSGTFVYDPVAGTVLGVGENQPLTATFTPSNPSNFNTIQSTVFIDVIASHDFGDAPNTYPVVLAQDGARHLISDLFLGGMIDSDLDGQPSDQADGDGDDEDGMTWVADPVSVLGSATVASWLVQVSAAGKLDAWIDFNQDGDWEDASEQIHVSVDVNAGFNLLPLTVPAGSTPGATFARLRLSSTGGLGPAGAAVDGEVEDYLITILDGSNSPGPSIHLVDPLSEISVASDEFVVLQGSIESFRAPVANLGSLELEGGASDETVILNLFDMVQIPSGGLHLDGGLGGNQLVVIGDNETLDLTDPSLSIQRFRHVDLIDVTATQIVIDVVAVANLSPMLKVLEIDAGLEDLVSVKDAPDWRMTEPIISGSSFILTAQHVGSGGETIQANLPRPWQNFLRPGDVNNDGQVTASDALRIINELSRREFSDPDSQDLDDPISVGIWPSDYFDHNGDQRATALDALRVINDLARQSLSEGEPVPAQLPPSTTSDFNEVIEPSSERNDAPHSDVGERGTKQLKSDPSISLTSIVSLTSVDRAVTDSISTSPDDLELYESAVDQLLSDHGLLDGIIN